MRYFQYQEFMNQDFPFKIEVRDESFRHDIVPHAHEYFQVCYVLKGSCRHELNGKGSVLIKGDLFSVPPQFEHRIETIPDQEIKLVLIDFMPHLLDSSLRTLRSMENFTNFIFNQPFVTLNNMLLPKLNLTVQGQREAESLISGMLREVEEKQDGFALMVKADLMRLLVIAGREYARFVEQRPEEQLIRNNRKYFEAALAYIEQHYHREIKLPEVASVSAMSVAYFSTMFKWMMGRTFIEHLNDLRVKAAMQLLQQSEHTVEEIAFRTGFNHLTHFHRIFKKITGTTPAQFRKNSNHQTPPPPRREKGDSSNQ
ncbi:AraC family transcriptional regulator [Paenibacillus ferrarius]|uniref:AraC family transcriptional regulator n=1 Tax=Paenibacillus ferrarius TaxID=1469647 RepID=UPI003D2E6715